MIGLARGLMSGEFPRSSRPRRGDALALGLGLALGAGTAFAVDTKTVRQHSKMFDPGKVELVRGGVLTLTNEDPYIHHIYIESPGFNYDSGDQRPGRKLEIKFDQAGEFVVRCAIHLKMQLEVSVR